MINPGQYTQTHKTQINTRKLCWNSQQTQWERPIGEFKVTLVVKLKQSWTKWMVLF